VPVLDDTQRGIVEALDREGYVTLPFTDLAGDAEWAAVEAQGAAFIAETERTLAEGRSGKGAAGRVRRCGAQLRRRDPRAGRSLVLVLRVAADGRRRERTCAWVKLSYVDLWYTAQQPATDERVASQNWHVDFDDKHLLKAFVYLSDVDADAGPFEYVPGSQPGGKHHSVRPWVPMGYGRVPDEDVAKSVPPEEVATFTGPRGTLILCNTSGLHRGGFATSGLATATYCSPASLKALSNRNYSTPVAESTTDPVVRYAVS
jgi:hypothetical protein